jgi:hypothetical protein
MTSNSFSLFKASNFYQLIIFILIKTAITIN